MSDSDNNLEACDVPLSLRTDTLSVQLEASGNAIGVQFFPPALTCQVSTMSWVSYGPELFLFGLALLALVVYLVLSYRLIGSRHAAVTGQSS